MSGETTVQIRARQPEDIPPLVEVLYAQQPETLYPLRNPLPIPPEDFLHARDALAAWTVEVDGVIAGHGCHTGPLAGDTTAAALNEVCAAGYGCVPADLSWVSALFVATGHRGLGLGRRLLQTVLDDIRARGLRPCLEVYPGHPAAMNLYLATGWRVVHQVRPDWLVEAKGDDGPDVLVMVHDA